MLMDRWIDKWIYEWMDGWIDGFMDEWMDGQVDRNKRGRKCVSEKKNLQVSFRTGPQ